MKREMMKRTADLIREEIKSISEDEFKTQLNQYEDCDLVNYLKLIFSEIEGE